MENPFLFNGNIINTTAYSTSFGECYFLKREGKSYIRKTKDTREKRRRIWQKMPFQNK